MVLKLDPRYPLVWRSPDGVQFGVAAPIATIDGITSADERMIAALAEGVSESGLGMIGRSAGATGLDVAALLQRVRPALVAPTPVAQRVLVSGAGATADAVAVAVASTGHSLVSDHPDLVVLVANFVVSPPLYGEWLRRDVPHLPVVVSDATVDIGPVVEPGLGPCLYCLLRDRTERDRAWPAIAAQLSGRANPADTPVLAGEVAAIVGRLVSSRLERGPASVHRALSLDIDSGVITATTVTARDDCGCVGLTAATGQRENDSPAVAPVAMLHPRQPRSTRARASSGPA